MTDEIVIRREGRAGRITLNRPKALNSLTYDMLRAIDAALTAWEADPDVALILIDASGDRAFAAGGDIVDLYETGRAGDFAFGRQFWADEYRLNARIARYGKPYVAFMHGFVMGGGVGVSALGSHRIVTDGTAVAMPECGIGLVPDVGGSKLLADAPGHLGEYLGMTGARMGPADAIYAGFADAYVPAAGLEGLKATLVETGDVARIVEAAITPEGGTLAPLRPLIDAAFAAPSARAVEAWLENPPTDDAGTRDWAAKTLTSLRKSCPLSVATALEMIRAARSMTLEEALAQEYRFSWRCMSEGEFLEGIRAAVIDKDRTPNWARPRLADVSAADIRRMLSPPDGGDLTF